MSFFPLSVPDNLQLVHQMLDLSATGRSRRLTVQDDEAILQTLAGIWGFDPSEDYLDMHVIEYDKFQPRLVE